MLPPPKISARAQSCIEETHHHRVHAEQDAPNESGEYLPRFVVEIGLVEVYARRRIASSRVGVINGRVVDMKGMKG